MKRFGFITAILMLIALTAPVWSQCRPDCKECRSACRCGCHGKSASASANQALPADAGLSAFDGSIISFGFDMHKRLSDGTKDMMISPVSIDLLLGLALSGAQGETAAQMEKVMYLPGVSNIHGSSRELLQYYASLDPKITLNIANSFWYADDLNVHQVYIDDSKRYYDAEVVKGMTVNDVNTWVNRKTNGKISHIVDTVSNVQSILLNAVYFKGNWSKQFDPKLTVQQPFYTAGTQYNVPMMSRSGDKVLYFQNDAYQAVALPYGDKKLYMYVFLPSENSGLPAFLSSFNAQDWVKVRKEFREMKVDVKLPRFKSEYEAELNTPLMNMGMLDAFGASADFGKMSRSPLRISQIKHKTFIEVNEAGTEAAGVTSGIMTMSFPMQFVANRPFFYIISDAQKGLPLFMGCVVKPSENK